MAKHREVIDLASWWTPKQALAHVQLSKGEGANKAILQRLRAGKLDVVAAGGWSQAQFGDLAVPNEEPANVPSGHWDRLSDESFWESGVAIFEFIHYSTIPNQTVWCFDLRFDPDEIKRTFPAPAAAEAAGSQSSKPESTKNDLPSVSDAHLKMWAKLYVEVYPESEDTSDKAWESAKGMFHGKSVSRQRAREAVNELRPRKAGRKTTAK